MFHDRHGERPRFSIAHELGHVVIAKETGAGSLAPAAHRGRKNSELERACDYFAACLLMPRRWVLDHHAQTPNARVLARTFDVSPTAMIARLHELGLA
jgi:Zn-dependent peptidase ImmA (M78 family)